MSMRRMKLIATLAGATEHKCSDACRVRHWNIKVEIGDNHRPLEVCSLRLHGADFTIEFYEVTVEAGIITKIGQLLTFLKKKDENVDMAIIGI